MARATDVPVVYDRGNIFADPLLNGLPTHMILDTGAQSTVLAKDAAARLSLKLEQLPGYAAGLGGTRAVYGFTANKFQIGRLQGSNFEMQANGMALSGAGRMVDGLLGADFLAAYDLDLDLPQHKAILYSVLGGCHAPSAALGGTLYTVPLLPPYDRADPRAFIRVEIDGKILTALIDSGAAHTVIFSNAAHRLGLDIAKLTTDRHVHMRGIGPRMPDAVRHVMTPIEIGNLTVSNLPVAIVDERSFDRSDMLLGLDFLFRVHAWFSFSSRTLILQYPPLPSPEAPA